MALAALAAYGLLDRAAKGEVRVTERARSILHPQSEEEKRLAVREAALSPALYRDLRERFHDVPMPPAQGVETYLNRAGFNPTAVRPAARAFLQTMSFLQELGVIESSGPPGGQTQESALQPRREETPTMQAATAQTQTAAPPPTVTVNPGGGELPLNEPNLSIRGGTVLVEALLDFDGLTELEEQIKALKTILRRRQPSAAFLGTSPSEE